jgi:hypothetical protein
MTSEKIYAVNKEQAEKFDIDHIKESTILGFIYSKCKFTLSPNDFKEYASFEKTKFYIKHTRLASFVSVIAIIISIISFVIVIINKKP